MLLFWLSYGQISFTVPMTSNYQINLKNHWNVLPLISNTACVRNNFLTTIKCICAKVSNNIQIIVFFIRLKSHIVFRTVLFEMGKLYLELNVFNFWKIHRYYSSQVKIVFQFFDSFDRFPSFFCDSSLSDFSESSIFCLVRHNWTSNIQYSCRVI